MAGDLLVFLGCDDLNPATGWRRVRGAVRGTIPGDIRTDAGPSQATTDRGADFRIIFTDAASEYEQVESTQRGNHCRYLLAHGIAEHLNGKPCVSI